MRIPPDATKGWGAARQTLLGLRDSRRHRQRLTAAAAADDDGDEGVIRPCAVCGVPAALNGDLCARCEADATDLRALSFDDAKGYREQAAGIISNSEALALWRREVAEARWWAHEVHIGARRQPCQEVRLWSRGGALAVRSSGCLPARSSGGTMNEIVYARTARTADGRRKQRWVSDTPGAGTNGQPTRDQQGRYRAGPNRPADDAEWQVQAEAEDGRGLIVRRREW